MTTLRILRNLAVLMIFAIVFFASAPHQVMAGAKCTPGATCSSTIACCKGEICGSLGVCEAAACIKQGQDCDVSPPLPCCTFGQLCQQKKNQLKFSCQF